MDVTNSLKMKITAQKMKIMTNFIFCAVNART